jgi:hypothetical protein
MMMMRRRKRRNDDDDALATPFGTESTAIEIVSGTEIL